MTTVPVPIITFWDVLSDAFDNPWFWYLTVAGVLIHSLTTRILMGRWHRRYHSSSYFQSDLRTNPHPSTYPNNQPTTDSRRSSAYRTDDHDGRW